MDPIDRAHPIDSTEPVDCMAPLKMPLSSLLRSDLIESNSGKRSSFESQEFSIRDEYPPRSKLRKISDDCTFEDPEEHDSEGQKEHVNEETFHKASHGEIDEEIGDWRDYLPSESSSRFPKTFQGVLKLMDELVHRERCGLSKDLSFFDELYDNRRHGDRKGCYTRRSLRALKKAKDRRLSWHQPKSEWSPKDREHLASFIEVLIVITKRVTKSK